MSDSGTSTRYFTKHLFRAGLECPVKLFYYANNYPQDDRIKPFLRHAGFNKHQLKLLLHRQYQAAKLIDGNYDSAAGKSEEFLKSIDTTLFEAVFISDRKLAKVPLLVKNEKEIDLYFVQTKVFNPHKNRLTNHAGKLHKKWIQYIYDAAFQVSIIQQCHPDWVITPHLLLPDKTAESRTDELNKKIQLQDNISKGDQLLYEIDISSHVEDVLQGREQTLLPEGLTFDETLNRHTELFFESMCPPTEIGMKCRDCEFRISDERIASGCESGFNNCWNASDKAPAFSPDKAHVFDLIGPGIRRLMEKGIYLQEQVPLDDLADLKSITYKSNAITHKQRQALQVMQEKGETVPDEIIKEPLFKEIDRWQYPLHFLDFEAGNYAVPMRNNRRPYHLVVFQLSCHTLQEDGTLSHHQWLAESQNPYPNYELVRHLKSIPGILNGTIIQYSNFERSALKIIRKELIAEQDEVDDAAELIQWLRAVIERSDSNHPRGPYLADLSRLVRQYYYNRSMKDSLSIKDVVQSVMTISNHLQKSFTSPYSGSNFDSIHWWQWNDEKSEAENPYKLLRALQPEVGIGRGTEAMLTFGRILSGELSPELRSHAYNALRKYCELDTLAMVMIFEHWKKMERNK